MLSNVFLALSMILALAYAGVLHRYRRDWERLPVRQLPPGYQPQTTISVIIAARNEAGSIAACLDSILACGYPEDLLELWVVDDHSEDATAAVVERYGPPVRLLRLADGLPDGLPAGSYKKAAIRMAVERAGGELMVLTDADCLAPAQWLHRMAACYEQYRPAAIAGPVLLLPDKDLLSNFTALDTAGTMLLTGAGIGGGWQHLGNGANLAYPRELFLSIGGFAGNEHHASGDDVFLLQKIARAHPGGVIFLKNESAAVRTYAPDSWSTFYRQRLRWGSKNKALQEWPARMILLLVWLFCWSLLLLLPLAFRQPGLVWAAAGCWGAKALADYLLLRNACAYFRQERLMTWFWPSFLIHTLYIPLLGAAGIIAPATTWKGRPIS